MRKILLLMLCLALAASQLWAQNRTITGRVVDDKGTPLAGVTVSAVNSDIRAMTNPSGDFSISVPSTVRQLEFSYVGFASFRTNIGASSTVNVTLNPSTSDLEDVVVTGVNRQQRSKYAGAATKVTAEQLRNVPTASFENALQGKVPGLSILNGSGQPGNPASVILRGPTSISGGSDPLYVVDGIPVEASTFQGYNVNDFESIDVLKDGVAMALYGNRGAGGVIVITTKRGAPGKARLGYSGQMGVKMAPTFNYEMMNSAELLAAQEKLGTIAPGQAQTLPGWLNSKLHPSYATATPAVQAQRDRTLDSLRKINTDWDDLYFRNGTFQNHEISLSGSVGRGRIYSNLAYYHEEGLIIQSYLKRVTWRNNFDYSDDRLLFRINSTVGYTKRGFQESTGANNLNNPFLVTRITPPYLTPYKSDGSWNTSTAQPYYGVNLLQGFQYNLNYNDQLKLTLSTNIDYKLLRDVSVGLTAGVDFRETNSTVWRDPRAFVNYSSQNIQTRSGSYSDGLTRNLVVNARPNITYARVFNKRHDVEVSLYSELIREFDKAFSFVGYGVDVKRPNSASGITQGNSGNNLFSSVGGGKSQRGISSVLGMARYTFDGKYTLNASYRRDGSSILPEKNRYHGFFAVGGVWDIKKEAFLATSRKINTLRLKVSYGESANAQNFPLGDFGYLGGYTTSQYQGITSLVQFALPSEDYDWEYTKTTNISIDYAFFGSRLYGDINLYNKLTDNLFVQETVSTYAGLGETGVQVNAGAMRNRGIEYIINYDVIRGRKFTWSVNVNGAINENEITSLGTATSYELGTTLISVGKPLGSHYEIKWAGVDAATGAPLYYTENGKVTNDIAQAFKFQDYGTYFPKYTGGFGTSLRFSGFDLSAQFSYAAETYRVNNLEFFVENPSFLSGGFNQASSFNFWSKPGDVASTQSPNYQNQFSSKYIQDASFLRLRQVTLSYTLPKDMLQRIKHISNVRFYVLGQNLLTWTKWRGYDPEDDNNISLSEFPNPRAVTAGLEVTF